MEPVVRLSALVAAAFIAAIGPAPGASGSPAPVSVPALPTSAAFRAFSLSMPACNPGESARPSPFAGVSGCAAVGTPDPAIGAIRALTGTPADPASEGTVPP